LTLLLRLLAALLLVAVLGPPARAQSDDAAPAAGEADAGPEAPVDADAGPPPAAEPPPPAAAPVTRLCPVAVNEPAIEPTDAARASRIVGGFELSGQLTDDPVVLHDVLGQLLPDGAIYNAERERCVLARLARLRYHVASIAAFDIDGGKVTLSFALIPATLVRHVDVAADFGWRTWALPPILTDDIKQQLHLHEGDALPVSIDEQHALLARASVDLEEWFQKRGFFDARVIMATLPLAKATEVTLVVKIKAGKPYTIGTVHLRGNAAVRDEEILALFDWSNFFGYTPVFTKDRLNDALDKVKALYQSRGFPGVRVSATYDPATSPDRLTHTVNFDVIIEEKRRIDVVFQGNSSFLDEQLRKKLTMNAESSFDDFEVQNSADSVRGFYQRAGYFNTEVTWERVRLLPDYERIIFHVVEGRRQRVAGVRFIGNISIPSDRLSGVIATRVWSFAGGGYLTTPQLEQDVEAIRAVYLREGYAGVQVLPEVAPSVALLDGPGAAAAVIAAGDLTGKLYVRYHIIEGPRDTVSVIEFIGNQVFNDKDLEQLSSLKVGGAFSASAMEHDRALILTAYTNRGYIYAEVSSRFELERPGLYRVSHVILEGQRVELGPVVVRGNFKTKAWVIRDVLGLHDGQAFDADDVLNGQAELQQTGLFSKVLISFLGSSPEEQFAVVHPLVEVAENADNIYELELAGGYEEQALTYGSMTLTSRNVGGVGISWALTGLSSLDVGGDYGVLGDGKRIASLSSRVPYWWMRRWLATPLDLGAQAFYNERDDTRFGLLESYGLTGTLSRQLVNGFSFRFAYSYVHRNRDKDLIRPAGVDEDETTTQVATDVSTMGVTLALDRRTDQAGQLAQLAPVDGYKVSGNFEVASTYLGGRENFLKLGGSAIFLHPARFLGHRWVFSQGLRYDHGVPLGGTVLLPETERFTSGGSTTVRGYEQDRLRTEIIQSPTSIPGIDTYVVRPAGGDVRAIYNADLQVTVCGKCLAGLPLASGVFVDVGTLVNSFKGFDTDDIRVGAGLSFIKIVIPYLTFSIEYAIPLTPALGDDTSGRFHLNVGFIVN
jgi:outer membrane protein insertion porin family